MPFQKGHKHSEETKLKIKLSNLGRQSWLGKKHTLKTRKKISKSNKGKIFSNKHKKNISKSMSGKKLSKERRKQISIQSKKMWSDLERRKEHSKKMKGRKFTEEHKKKISQSNLGKKMSKQSIEKMRIKAKGRIPKIKGKTFEEYYGIKKAKKIKNKISLTTTGRKNKFKGKIRKEFYANNNPNWRGGTSFLPYSCTWNKLLKKKIRVRDNYICQYCKIKENKLKERLHIHHIDYNKKNCEISNLISLCRSCHCKTNGKRNYFTELFNNLLKNFYYEKNKTILVFSK